MLMTTRQQERQYYWLAVAHGTCPRVITPRQPREIVRYPIARFIPEAVFACTRRVMDTIPAVRSHEVDGEEFPRRTPAQVPFED
jgi:hypothetical protein